ncbi:MAG: L,D-transpeptidase family protein [Candidatus Omnitrophota bacterium]
MRKKPSSILFPWFLSAALIVGAALSSVSHAGQAVEAAADPVQGPGLALPAETAAFKTMFAAGEDPHAVIYEIKPGDTLGAISKKHHVTIDLIQRINGLTSDKIRPGKKLKIPSYVFSVVVDKSQNTLILKGDEEVLKTYQVSTGENNATPTGVFKVTDRLVNPTWYKEGAVAPYGDPRNILGTRWIGFDKEGYGIHGTTEPEKLGQQVTSGCVRLRNEEVEELFIFTASGAEVTVVD